MALQARIVHSFERTDSTPDAILWEGIVEVVNPEKENDKGYPERLLKGTMKLVRGKNGNFIGTPARKGSNGEFYPYYELGQPFQRIIVPVLEAAFEEAISTPEPSTGGDLTSEAADSFSDLNF